MYSGVCFTLCLAVVSAGQLFKRGISMYQDKNLICKDCGAEFVFHAGEQEFYQPKAL
jgi:hypothetical protein